MFVLDVFRLDYKTFLSTIHFSRGFNINLCKWLQMHVDNEKLLDGSLLR